MILFFAVVLVLLGGSVWYFGGAAVNMLTPLSERYRREGDSLLAEGHLAEAVLTYRQAVEADGKNSRAMQSLAAAYEQQGRLRMAERYRARAQGRQPAYKLPPSRQGSGLTPAWLTAVSDAPPLGGALAGDRIVTAHEDGTVAALEISTGAVIWLRNLPGPLTSAPAIGGGVVVVGAADGHVTALRLEDGQPLWQVDTGGPVYAPPAFEKGVFFCPSSSGSIFAILNGDGTLVWQRKLDSPLNGTPAVHDGRVFLGSNNGRLYALNEADGTLAWPDGVLTGGPVESQPDFLGHRVIFGSGDGRVYALDTVSGGQFWRVSTPDSVYAGPLVLADRTFIASSGRSLSAVNTLTGERLWQTMLPSPLRNPPDPAVSYLYQVGEGDPNLYILRQDTGALVATVPTGDWLAAGPWFVATKSGGMVFVLGKDGSVVAFRGQYPE